MWSPTHPSGALATTSPDARAADSPRSKHSHPRVKAHRSRDVERIIVKGIPVTPKLRTVIDLARLPRSILDLGAVPTRSPVEDSAYDVVRRAGLRAPREVNAPYRLASGTVYPDLRWPELRLIVEVDSAEWRDDPLAQLADRTRQAELEAEGERVLRVRKAELRRPQFIARLRAAGVPTSSWRAPCRTSARG